MLTSSGPVTACVPTDKSLPAIAKNLEEIHQMLLEVFSLLQKGSKKDNLESENINVAKQARQDFAAFRLLQYSNLEARPSKKCESWCLIQSHYP